VCRAHRVAAVIEFDAEEFDRRIGTPGPKP
jgi:hypothetical protein